MSKPAIPKGTRDFTPVEMARRNYIFKTIRSTYERFGFVPIETPAMENLNTLTGKYGEEGDQLIFKILNNGDFLQKSDAEALADKDSKKFSFSISKKALRYDLTVPFARFVVMHQGVIPMPFKRYQIQPVWRGDRPGKGRYQEFFQCDADIIGSESLINEIELIQVFDEVLSNLKVPGVQIKINNRKILSGIAEINGISDRLKDFTIALDKLDKVGVEGVEKELTDRGFEADIMQNLKPFFSLPNDFSLAKSELLTLLEQSETGMKGIEELQFVFDKIDMLGLRTAKLQLDVTLARGLDYYTGAIFEVVVQNSGMGSICGGGRYDDLTGIFGLKGVSGVGISFGADRLYDVMFDMNLFPDEALKSTEVLFVNFGETEADYCLNLLKEVRNSGIAAEIYPDAGKMKKQMKYADDRFISIVVLAGSNEINTDKLSVKIMKTGDQFEVGRNALVSFLQSHLKD